MAWTPKAAIQLATDLTMAVTTLDPGSQFRAAIQGVADAILTAAISADPTLAANVTAAATEAVQDALAAGNVATSEPVPGVTMNGIAFLADALGVLSKIGFDENGEVAEETMQSAEGKGMPRVVASGSGFRFVDQNGRHYALGFDGTGQFDEIAKWAFVNLIHRYTGPDRPFVYPSNFVYWERTDANGDIIETLKGVRA